MVLRRVARIVNLVLTVVVAIVWFQLYRPQLVGGPAAYAVVQGTSMDGTLADGDLVVTREHAEYPIGAVVAFRAPGGVPVIHRIVGGDATTGYVTRGDNRAVADPWRVPAADVLGSVALHLPRAGAVVRLLREPPLLVWLVGSVVLSCLWWADRRLGRRRAPLLSSVARPDHPAARHPPGGQ